VFRKNINIFYKFFKLKQSYQDKDIQLLNIISSIVEPVDESIDLLIINALLTPSTIKKQQPIEQIIPLLPVLYFVTTQNTDNNIQYHFVQQNIIMYSYCQAYLVLSL
jgi:hypothetical protein|tara:strand:+ start:223 stop:543 length:321 start_codon:yes stop_codon:yes gene_type:complete